MRRIIFGLVMLWAALFGAWQVSGIDLPHFKSAGFVRPARAQLTLTGVGGGNISGGGSSLAIDGVGAQASSAGVGVIAITGFSTSASNDVIVVEAQTFFADITSVVSTALGPLAQQNVENTGTFDIERWWIKAPSALTNDTITVTSNAGGASIAANAYAFSGSSNPSSPWDVTGVPSTTDPFSITPVSSNTVVLCGFNTSNSSPAPGSGFSSLTSMQSPNHLTEYKAVVSPVSTNCTMVVPGTTQAAIADVLH